MAREISLETTMFMEWLEVQIKTAEWSRTAAAVAFDVSRQTLHRWINGDIVPSVGRLVHIAEIMANKRSVSIETIWDELLQIFLVESLLAKQEEGIPF